MNSKNPILVTGSHRSGTTWAGHMLSAAANVAYIHEPFNIGLKSGLNPVRFKHMFQYIIENQAEAYDEIIEDILRFRYPLCENLAKAKTAREYAGIVKNQGMCLLSKAKNQRPLIKDPIAIFSAEWLYKRFNMQVLVLIRHPAAFCSSLKIKGWAFDFNNFLNQPLLMERFLYPFGEEIEEFARDQKNIVDQAILLWKCFAHTTMEYKKNHEDWLFVRHEDLSTNPLKQFKIIFEKLNLTYSQRVKNAIADSSGEHNPGEQLDGNEFKRNSKKCILTWKSRLTEEEIGIIRRKTADIAGSFYDQSDW